MDDYANYRRNVIMGRYRAGGRRRDGTDDYFFSVTPSGEEGPGGGKGEGRGIYSSPGRGKIVAELVSLVAGLIPRSQIKKALALLFRLFPRDSSLEEIAVLLERDNARKYRKDKTPGQE